MKYHPRVAVGHEALIGLLENTIVTTISSNMPRIFTKLEQTRARMQTYLDGMSPRDENTFIDLLQLLSVHIHEVRIPTLLANDPMDLIIAIQEHITLTFTDVIRRFRKEAGRYPDFAQTMEEYVGHVQSHVLWNLTGELGDAILAIARDERHGLLAKQLSMQNKIFETLESLMSSMVLWNVLQEAMVHASVIGRSLLSEDEAITRRREYVLSTIHEMDQKLTMIRNLYV
jgi:hypothetical protein